MHELKQSRYLIVSDGQINKDWKKFTDSGVYRRGSNGYWIILSNKIPRTCNENTGKAQEKSSGLWLK